MKLSRRKKLDAQVFPTVHSLTVIGGKTPMGAASIVCSEFS